jgi:hypothetical protein
MPPHKIEKPRARTALGFQLFQNSAIQDRTMLIDQAALADKPVRKPLDTGSPVATPAPTKTAALRDVLRLLGEAHTLASENSEGAGEMTTPECGLAIDRHQRVDMPEGPEFFCEDLDDATVLQLRQDAYVARCIERWEAEDAKRPPAQLAPIKKKSYRTPQSTIDAFWYVMSLNDSDQLARWLANHPADAPELFKIWKGKQCWRPAK